MKAGRLRSRVMLQEPVESRDSYGAIVKGWRDLKEVAANIRYQTGAEYQRHHADLGEAGVSVRIRYRKGISNALRVRLADGTLLAVAAVLHDADHHDYVDLVCKTGVNDGR